MGEVFFETLRLGRYVKITAIDSASGIEVILTGDARLPVEHLKRLALHKLERRLRGEAES